MDLFEICLRLGAATLIGCVIGFNRDLHGKPTGVRTLGLLSLGAAAIVLGAHDFMGSPSTDPNVASRVVQGVLTGIGFLGAGVILHTPADHRVRGLTTATCVWLTACIGLICGSGNFRVLSVLLPLALIVLLFGGTVERQVHRLWIGSDKKDDGDTSNA